MKRLRKVKAQPIDPKLLAIVIGRRALNAKEAQQIEKQIADLAAEAERVSRTRQALAQIPSLVVRGSGLL